ncbi:MAG: hypothetical protein HXX09_09880 [Bacteroidetes bacterium]|nr:hypothetical protein [Bacteroidota bacterium]
MKLKTDKDEIIEIEDNPFCIGGQAGIHRLVNSQSKGELVAKIFFAKTFFNKSNSNVDNMKLDLVKNKIEFLVNNPPYEKGEQSIQDAFAWPLDILLDENNQFKGFLLPYNDSIDLLRIIGNRKLLSPWEKFKSKNPNSFLYRLKICYNISRLLTQIHSRGLYTMVDLKPENILLKENGLVSYIDVDSIQIAKSNSILFHADVYTPEYSPAEFHNKKVDFKNDVIDQAWDLFSFGVLTYQLLFEIHPFAGMNHKINPNIHTVDDFIAGGFFARGSEKNNLDLAPPHFDFDKKLSDDLKNLFFECFVSGHNNPKLRPTAKSWSEGLRKEIEKNPKI